MAADELGIDPVEIRRKNFIPPDAFPFTTRHRRDLRQRRVRRSALDEALRTPATTRCAPSRRHGASAATRSCSASACAVVRRDHRRAARASEYGAVEIARRRHAPRVKAGTSAHGQGHETAFSHDRSRRARRPDGEDPRSCSPTPRWCRAAAAPAGRARSRSAGARCSRRSEVVLDQAKQLAAHLLEASARRHRDRRRTAARRRRRARARRSAWAELAARQGRRDEGSSRCARARLQSGRLVVPVRRAHRGRRGRPRDRAGRARCATSRSTTAARSSTRCSSPASSTAASRRASRRRCASRCSTTTTATRSPANLMDYAMPSAAELPSFEVVQHRDAEPAQPARRQGHRRVGDDRLDARGAQRGGRRALPPRRPPHRHAVHRRAGVARDRGRCVRVRSPTRGASPRPRSTTSPRHAGAATPEEEINL